LPILDEAEQQILCRKFYSICNSSIEINDMADNRKGKNGTYAEVASNGMYFVCGFRAYPWLPLNSTGFCCLGYVVPHIRLITSPLSEGIVAVLQNCTPRRQWHPTYSDAQAVPLLVFVQSDIPLMSSGLTGRNVLHGSNS